MNQEVLTNIYSEDKIELVKKRISGWLRQSRYRANRNDVHIDIELQDIIDIYESENYKCSYCGAPARSPDHPFSIKEKGPCVPANVVPCCDVCRNKKKTRNIIKYMQDGEISEDKLLEIMKRMVDRKGGDIIKSYIGERWKKD